MIQLLRVPEFPLRPKQLTPGQVAGGKVQLAVQEVGTSGNLERFACFTKGIKPAQ